MNKFLVAALFVALVATFTQAYPVESEELEDVDESRQVHYITDASDHHEELHDDDEDLEVAASGHGGHGHDDNHGWLDMGAYTHDHGAFGWYADYPVGHGYRRR